MSTTTPITSLEQAALFAHRAGWSWDRFWAEHADQVREAEPWSVPRYHRLVRRLLHLLTSGEHSGQFAVGDPDVWEQEQPWEADDAASQPDDTITTARLRADLFQSTELHR